MAKTTNQTELTALIKQEKDVNVQNRLVAVRAVRDLGMPQARVAEIFDRDRTTISRWTEWYDHDGPDGLRDLPRSGRPTKADPDILDHTMKEVAEMDKVLPERVREIIHEKTGTWYNPDYVRELMRKYGMSSKVPSNVHVNHASQEEVYDWQGRMPDTISSLIVAGFLLFQLDEAFFIHDTKWGRKYWCKIGKRIYGTYTGSHKMIAAFGAIGQQGRKMVLTYDAANSKTFIAFLKELRSKYGKIAVMVDGAPYHKSNVVMDFLEANADTIRLIYLPKGSPYLNAVEQLWNIAKRKLLVGEYYKTFDEMHRAMSQFFRSVRVDHIDIERYIYRDVWKETEETS